MPVDPHPPPPPGGDSLVYLGYIDEVLNGDHENEAKLKAIGKAVKNSKK